MRRPLFMLGVCLVIWTALRLGGGREGIGETGGACAGRPSPAESLTNGEVLQVTGQVYQKDENGIYLQSVVVLRSNAYGQSAADPQQHIPYQENFICEIPRAMTVPLGSVVTLKGVFSPFSRAGNPGEFDFCAYYGAMGIGGRIKKAEILSREDGHWFIREGLFGIRSRLKERLYRIFPQDEAAVMCALLLGEKGDLDGGLRDLYKRNGILHILSISSLHITIIGMSAYRLLRKASVPPCPAAAAGCLLLLLYGCMTGFGVSACRAIGMYVVKMLAEAVGRTYDMLTALGLVGAVMVSCNPGYLLNSGFLLSFASVLGIGVVYPALLPPKDNKGRKVPGRPEAVLSRPVRLGKALGESALVSISITLATLPVQLWFYFEVPVYSTVLNLLVIPFLKPMMITGLLALMVPGLEFLGCVSCAILEGYRLGCGVFDGLPFRTWNPGRPEIWQVAAYYLLLLGVVAAGNFRKGKVRRGNTVSGLRRLAGIRICLPCLAVLLLGVRPPSENSVMFLDVGQGDCILVRTSLGRTYLFDCGSSSRGGVGRYVLVPCLKYYGIRRIDAMFISHPDSDHMNGALELLRSGKESGITVGELVLPAIENGARGEQFGELLDAAAHAPGGPVPVGYLSAGDRFCPGGAVFTCLHPGEGFAADNANSYSLCVYVEFGEEGDAREGWSLLLTGDVEGKGEEALLEEIRARNIRPVTVLKVAHHGSRNSTSGELLERIKPLLAVVSCGSGNGYGHPHEELLERLEECGTHSMRTSWSGAVTVTFRRGAVLARPYIAP